jgi:hypothetical protein
MMDSKKSDLRFRKKFEIRLAPEEYRYRFAGSSVLSYAAGRGNA